MIVARVTLQQARQVTLELNGEAREGVVGRTASEMSAQERTRGVAQLCPVQAWAGVEAHELGVGEQDVLGELPTEAKNATVVLAGELVEAGRMEVAQPFTARIDALYRDRALDVFGAIGRCRGIGQIPGVQLDDQRSVLGDLLGRLLRQRPVGLHLVHVDSEQQLEVLCKRLEERPLVALEVHPDGAAHRRERLIAASVQQLDQDVGVAVGFPICAPGAVQRVRAVGSPGRAPAGSRALWQCRSSLP